MNKEKLLHSIALLIAGIEIGFFSYGAIELFNKLY